MRWSPHHIPKYRRHRASGQAIVTINARDIYLGPYNTKASHELYEQLIKEWIANDRVLPITGNGFTIEELLAAFNDFAKEEYAAGEGQAHSEYENYRAVLKLLRKLFADTLVADFGPNKFRTVVDEMVTRRWTRASINRQMGRLRRIFRWGVSREIVPVSVLQSLQTVEGLRSGRGNVQERPPVQPVTDQQIQSALPHMNEIVQAMVKLQVATAMRAGEVVRMRESELYATGEVWTYEFKNHKTCSHNVRRVVFLNQELQKILAPFRDPGTGGYFFSPALAETARRERLHRKRKTPTSCGNTIGTNRKENPQRRPGKHYTVGSYREAIRRACIVAAGGIPPEMKVEVKDDVLAKAQKRKALAKWKREVCWSPGQLRHTAATRIRAAHDLDTAQVILGHTTARTTERYASPSLAKARMVAAQLNHSNAEVAWKTT